MIINQKKNHCKKFIGFLFLLCFVFKIEIRSSNQEKQKKESIISHPRLKKCNHFYQKKKLFLFSKKKNQKSIIKSLNRNRINDDDRRCLETKKLLKRYYYLCLFDPSIFLFFSNTDNIDNNCFLSTSMMMIVCV